MKEYREGLQVETPAGPLYQVVQDGQGDGGGFELLEEHKGRVLSDRKESPGRGGGW